MAQAEGVAQGVRVDQEGSFVVLRFVLQVAETERIPVEMRGKRVSGVLQEGDRIRLVSSDKSIRDSDGVARPKRVTNLSTSSTVSVPGGGMIGGMMSLVVSIGVSVLSGILSAVLIALISGGAMEAAPPSEGASNTQSYLVPTQTPGGTHPAVTQTPGGTPSATPGRTDTPSAFPVLTLLVGVAVTVFVFLVIYVRPRLR